jgi:hypothetical protein
MHSFLPDMAFSRCHFDTNVYNKKLGNPFIICVFYLDGLILTGSDLKILNHVRSNLKKKIQMINLGYCHYFLFLQVLKTKEGIYDS